MGLLTRDAFFFFFFSSSGCLSAGLRVSIVKGLREDTFNTHVYVSVCMCLLKLQSNH